MDNEKALQGFSNAMDKVIKEVAPPSFLGRNYCHACQNYLSDDEEMILKEDWAYDMIEVKDPDTGKEIIAMCNVCHDEWTNELNGKYAVGQPNDS